MLIESQHERQDDSLSHLGVFEEIVRVVVCGIACCTWRLFFFVDRDHAAVVFVVVLPTCPSLERVVHVRWKTYD